MSPGLGHPFGQETPRAADGSLHACADEVVLESQAFMPRHWALPGRATVGARWRCWPRLSSAPARLAEMRPPAAIRLLSGTCQCHTPGLPEESRGGFHPLFPLSQSTILRFRADEVHEVTQGQARRMRFEYLQADERVQLLPQFR
jgi:hypothetical protein